MGKNRDISESTKKLIAGNQNYKCANYPGSNLDKLEVYPCPYWQIDGPNKGCFDASGYEIDHIVEYVLSEDNSDSNLQALCKCCHGVKTKMFNREYKKKSTITNTCTDIELNIYKVEEYICELNYGRAYDINEVLIIGQLLKNIALPENQVQLDKLFEIWESFSKINNIDHKIVFNGLVYKYDSKNIEILKHKATIDRLNLYNNPLIKISDIVPTSNCIAHVLDIVYGINIIYIHSNKNNKSNKYQFDRFVFNDISKKWVCDDVILYDYIDYEIANLFDAIGLNNKILTKSFKKQILESHRIYGKSKLYQEFDRSNILVFNNCVYDFSKKEFRNIYPSDYVFQTTGYDWIEPSSEEINEVELFMKQIFPNKNELDFALRCEYMCLTNSRPISLIFNIGNKMSVSLYNKLIKLVVGNLYGIELNNVDFMDTKQLKVTTKKISKKHRIFINISYDSNLNNTINSIDNIAQKTYENMGVYQITYNSNILLFGNYNIDNAIIIPFRDGILEPMQYDIAWANNHKCAFIKLIINNYHANNCSYLKTPDSCKEYLKEIIENQRSVIIWFNDVFRYTNNKNDIIAFDDIFNLFKENTLANNYNQLDLINILMNDDIVGSTYGEKIILDYNKIPISKYFVGWVRQTKPTNDLRTILELEYEITGKKENYVPTDIIKEFLIKNDYTVTNGSLLTKLLEPMGINRSKYAISLNGKTIDGKKRKHCWLGIKPKTDINHVSIPLNFVY